MELIRCGERLPETVPTTTGTVWLQPVHPAPDPACATTLIITFLPGARTDWHTHPLGQTLHILSGCSWFRAEGRPKLTLAAGDTVVIAPGERHWHGATAAAMTVQVAIQERRDGRYADWAEPVDDDDYRSA